MLSLDNLFSISEMYVHILKIVISQPIALKKNFLVHLKKNKQNNFSLRGTAIIRNEEQMKNFTCSDNDSKYIFFSFSKE